MNSPFDNNTKNLKLEDIKGENPADLETFKEKIEIT